MEGIKWVGDPRTKASLEKRLQDLGAIKRLEEGANQSGKMGDTCRERKLLDAAFRICVELDMYKEAAKLAKRLEYTKKTIHFEKLAELESD